MKDYQLRLFDGKPVVTFRAKFGDVEIEDDDVDEFVLDADIVLVVKVAVSGASVKSLPSGDWQRTNGLSISAMRVATGALRTHLAELFGFDDQLSFPSDVSSLDTGVDRLTGEVRDVALASFLTEG